MLIVALPAVLWGLTPHGNMTDSSLPALGVMVIAGIRFSAVVFARTRRLYELTFWIFTFIFMGMAPFVQSRLDERPGTTPWFRFDLIPHAWAVVYVGLVAFLAGSLLGSRGGSRAKAPRPISVARTTVVALAGTGSAAYFIVTLGLSSFFTDRYELAEIGGRTGTDPVVGALFSGLARMGLLIGCLLIVARLRTTHRRSLGLWAFAVLPFAALFVLVNPLTSPRFLVGITYLAILVATGLLRQMRAYRTVFIGLLVGMVTVFPFLNLFRLASGQAAAGGALEAMTTGDYDAFVQIVNAIDYVGAHGSTQGMQMMGVLLFFVPRGVWPAKPYDSGILLAQFQHYRFENLSAPLWSELYLNAGMVGVATGFFLLGLALRRVDARVDRQITLTGMPSLINCVLPFYFLMLLRGSLLQAASQVAALALCVMLASAAPRSRQRAGAGSPHNPTLEA